MKVAWPTATCNLKRIIGPCHQYGHESLRAKLSYRTKTLYNCFRFFLGYIGHEKYFFRGHCILTYSFNHVLELAVTLCDPGYGVNRLDYLLDVCTSPLFNWQRDTRYKRIEVYFWNVCILCTICAIWQMPARRACTRCEIPTCLHVPGTKFHVCARARRC